MSETERARRWASTMEGHPGLGIGGLSLARGSDVGVRPVDLRDRKGSLLRSEREAAERDWLAPGATHGVGAGSRAREEEPDPLRTCFERDRDRILHCRAFRRLAGKTQVFVFPDDHQRTRLTHALEVAQVATAVARATRLNVALTEAIALAHDCGHGPGGHASEDAFSSFVEGGYDHAVWGADVVLQGLNLCRETLDGVRNHSWSRPSPSTPEGLVVSWADRVAYTCHDLEDAALAGVVDVNDLPPEVVEVCGTTRSRQLRVFIGALIDAVSETGQVGMTSETAGALASLRAFNYRSIYLRPESVAQSESVIAVLRALVEHFAAHPETIDAGSGRRDPMQGAVTYVAGMTDRYAFSTAISRLGWDPTKLPQGVDSPVG